MLQQFMYSLNMKSQHRGISLSSLARAARIILSSSRWGGKVHVLAKSLGIGFSFVSQQNSEIRMKGKEKKDL